MIHNKIIARTCRCSPISILRPNFATNYHHDGSPRKIGRVSPVICHLSSSNSNSNSPHRREERQERRKSQLEKSEKEKNEWKTKTISIPDQFIESASSYISTIRLMVASRLTSSLPDDDREQLLKSLNVDVNGDSKDQFLDSPKQTQSSSIHGTKTITDTNPRTSIGEAVAVSEAREISSKDNRAQKIDDEERRLIWEKAEMAAIERVKSDLLIQERRLALERWKAQLEEEAEKEKEVERELLGGLEGGERMGNTQRQQQQRSKQDDAGADGDGDEIHKEGEDVHPVLGPILVDLGYKRIHITTARALCAVPVWEKQRVYRHDRAKVMANDKLKTLELGLPGIIALHESKDGQLAILDGQHRIGMMSILEGKQIMPDNAVIDFDRILVEVFPQPAMKTPPSPIDDNDNNHAQDIFTEINKAEPVKLVDMPGIAKITDRRIIDGAASTLAETYPDMFKASQRCRIPHLNLDNLRDAIFAAGVLKRHPIRSQKALVEWMMARNEEMVGRYEKGGKGGSSAAEKKARKYSFYLGLDLAWLYD